MGMHIRHWPGSSTAPALPQPDRFAPRIIVGSTAAGDVAALPATAIPFQYVVDDLAGALLGNYGPGDIWIRPGRYTLPTMTVPISAGVYAIRGASKHDVRVELTGGATLTFEGPMTIENVLFTDGSIVHALPSATAYYSGCTLANMESFHAESTLFMDSCRVVINNTFTVGDAGGFVDYGHIHGTYLRGAGSFIEIACPFFQFSACQVELTTPQTLGTPIVTFAPTAVHSHCIQIAFRGATDAPAAILDQTTGTVESAHNLFIP